VDELFDVFRVYPRDIQKCRDAAEELIARRDSDVTARALHFLETEPDDEVRRWAISVLRGSPDANEFAFDKLLELVRSAEDPEKRRRSKYTRLSALAALDELADTSQQPQLDALVKETWAEEEKEEKEEEKEQKDEHAAPAVLAAALGTLRGDPVARRTLDAFCQEVRGQSNQKGMRAVCLALGECPPGPADGPLAAIARWELMGMSLGARYLDVRHSAIELLARFPPDSHVVRGLGEILLEDESEDLRLRAALTLNDLAVEGASRDLVLAAGDDNAEVRARSVEALERSVGENRAIRSLVEAAMEPMEVDVTEEPMEVDVTEERRSRLVDALRSLDHDRSLSTDLLSKEMAGDDRKRAQCAERMLLDLGGWSAVQRLSQRRATLHQLDSMLAKSEENVHETFEGTIKQARSNFRFALGVNILVVLVGVVLVGVAVAHLISTPEDFETWVLPGSAGVISLLIAQLFDNPRHNGRDDLATLVKVNVLFLGFLRQLNQIDATFKHGYIENRDFGRDDMENTVDAIQRAVARTLDSISVLRDRACRFPRPHPKSRFDQEITANPRVHTAAPPEREARSDGVHEAKRQAD
jgi:hypothetical protein